MNIWPSVKKATLCMLCSPNPSNDLFSFWPVSLIWASFQFFNCWPFPCDSLLNFPVEPCRVLLDCFVFLLNYDTYFTWDHNIIFFPKPSWCLWISCVWTTPFRLCFYLFPLNQLPKFSAVSFLLYFIYGNKFSWKDNRGYKVLAEGLGGWIRTAKGSESPTTA